MFNILSGPIAKVLYAFADLPPEANKEPGNGALEAGNFTKENTSADNETPPDYGALDEKFGDAPPAARQVTIPPIEPLRAPNEPAPAVKTEAPAKEPAIKTITKEDHPTDPLRFKDGTFKPKPGDDEPFPEIEPLKPQGKGPEPAKAPPAPATPPAAPVTPPAAQKPGEKPPEAPAAAPAKPEDKKNEPKLLTEAEIDAIEPKPTASDKTKNDFRILKENNKTAIRLVKDMEAKLAEAQAKITGELPADVKEKLSRLEEAEKVKAMFELENEPRLRAEYEGKLTNAEESIISKLTSDPRLKLSQAKADKLKQVGFDSAEGVALINGWVRQIRNPNEKAGYPGDELLANEVATWFHERRNIVNDRKSQIEGLRTDLNGYLQKRQEAEKGEFTEWGKKADTTLIELAKGHDWTDYMKESPGDTAEQKTFIEAHNKRVKDEIVPAFNAAILDVFQRKPDLTVSHVFNSMRLKFEVEPALNKAKEELTAAQARITELEALANGVRRVSAVADANQAPTAPVKMPVTGIAGAKEVSAEDAVDQFLASKNQK